MKSLYIECNMGAAGDMLMGALYELCDQKEKFLSDMNHAFTTYGVTLSAEPAVKCGISGTHMKVTVDGNEEHSHDVLPEHILGQADIHKEGTQQHFHEHAHNEDTQQHLHKHTHNEDMQQHSHDHPHHHAQNSYNQILDQIHTLPFPSTVKH